MNSRELGPHIVVPIVGAVLVVAIAVGFVLLAWAAFGPEALP